MQPPIPSIIGIGTIALCAESIMVSSPGAANFLTSVNLKQPSTSIAQLRNPPIDVPYVPTPTAVVMEMLQLAKVGRDDVVYDLGSGDGRIVITAAQKFGARGVGIELSPDLVEKSRENAKEAGVSTRTQFIQQDLFEADLRDATVVTLYLFPALNRKLRPKFLQELKPGTRIVSHNYGISGWKPDQVVTLNNLGRDHTVYLWIVPEKPVK